MVCPENGAKGIPCVYALLPNKKKQTYEMLFNTIKKQVTKSQNENGDYALNVQKIVTDFEIGVFSSVQKVFQDVEHKGCKFHHNAAIWKKLGEIGLHSLFYENAQFQEFIYMHYALCYVPTVDIVNTYNQVITPFMEDALTHYEEWEEFSGEIGQFCYYYCDTYIEKRNGREALFPPKLWTHYDTVLNDGVATNNKLESFNRTWNSIIGFKKNVWHVHEQFVKQESEARRAYLANAVAADLHTNSGRKQKALDSLGRLKFVVSAYNTTPIKDYISILAHDLQKFDK